LFDPLILFFTACDQFEDRRSHKDKKEGADNDNQRKQTCRSQTGARYRFTGRPIRLTHPLAGHSVLVAKIGSYPTQDQRKAKGKGEWEQRIAQTE
jgi:hypothetical protein